MTNQSTEIQPIEADEVELPETATEQVVLPQRQVRKEQNDRLKTVRMEINSMLPKPIQVWSKTAIIAFVLGLLIFWTLGLTALPAVIFGHIGIIATRQRERGRWLAVTGLVLGYATIALVFLAMLGGLLYYMNS